MRKEVIAHKNPKSPISEIFRTLRTNIQFMDRNKKMRTLLVTSTFPGEGKSWVASNLAVTFAQAGKRVVLIDADMRKGRQYLIFSISPKPGLSNYLSQAEIDDDGTSTEHIENYVQETDVQNLYVMPAGNVPPNPSELLVSAQMPTLLEDLKEYFDLIIIDGTPCELVTDSVILSRIVDSTLIVAAHKKTKKDALDRVIKNIKNVGGTIAGVVLNRMPTTSKKYGDTYYYYGSHDKQSSKNINKKMKEFDRRTDKNLAKLEKEMNSNRVENKKDDTYLEDKSPESIQEKIQEAIGNTDFEPKREEYVEEVKQEEFVQENNYSENNNYNSYNEENSYGNDYNNEYNNQNDYNNNSQPNNEVRDFYNDNNNFNNYDNNSNYNNYYNNNNDQNNQVNNFYNDNNDNNSNELNNNLNNIQTQETKESEDAFMDKTNEILKQINDYIEQEKRKLDNNNN